MNLPSQVVGPDLNELLRLFPAAANDFLAFESVPAKRVPPPYRGLLVHEHHMTVTVESYHGERVDVLVLDRQFADEFYARRILLATKKTRRVVQFGLVRINFRYCSQAVRDEIVSERTPVGRVLIEHDVLRVIEPTGFLRAIPGPEMVRHFGLSAPIPTYGRLAYIHCNEKPAIELLEIVAPEPGGSRS
jgi:hypothetical protein